MREGGFPTRTMAAWEEQDAWVAGRMGRGRGKGRGGIVRHSQGAVNMCRSWSLFLADLGQDQQGHEWHAAKDLWVGGAG